MAYAPDAAHIAVGLFSGRVEIFNSDLSEKIKGISVCREWIQDLKYSPGSPGTIQKAMALEKELKRRRRLLEIESGMLDNNASNYKGKKEIASRVDHRREKIEAL